MPGRILDKRLFENFFRLRIAPVGHVHVGFRYGIDFVCVYRPDTALAEVSLELTASGINILTTGRPEYRTRIHRRRCAHDTIFKLGFALFAVSIRTIPK